MFFIFNRGNLAGVDIGSSGVKVVKLKRRGSAYNLEEFGYAKSPSPDTEGGFKVRETLVGLIRTGRMKIKRVASIVCAPSLLLRHLYLPRMPKGDLREAVRWEMRKETNFPPDELICDFTNIGETRKGEETLYSIIAFGVWRKDVDRLIEILREATLEPIAIDVTPMAMLSSFDYNNVWEEGVNYAMVDLGAAKTTFAIFKDRKLRFVREIAFGGRDLTKRVAEGLSKTEEEAEEEKTTWGMGGKLKDILTPSVERLGMEIHRSFDYYQAQFRDTGAGKIFLCGGTAMLKGLDVFLSNALGIPCFVDDPLKNIKVDPKRFKLDEVRGIAPMLTPAIGLALRPY
ncbi:MAG: type IV pilus assembly protein PilM [Deltaproteobacteria bacterium]|nr:type IV pilus assembly protein PilM [Deltaproteobacteria bacterium]